MTDRAQKPRFRLNAEAWDDVADLCQEFSSACEISYENHNPISRAWLQVELQNMAFKFTKRAMNLRGDK